MSVHAGILSRIQRFHVINAGMALATMAVVGVIASQALGGHAPGAGGIRTHWSGNAAQARVAPPASNAVQVSQVPLVTAPQVPQAPTESVGGGNPNLSSPSSSAVPSPSGVVAAPASAPTMTGPGGAQTLGTTAPSANTRSGRAVGYVPNTAGSLTSGIVPVHGLDVRSTGLTPSTPASSSSSASSSPTTSVPSSVPLSSSTASSGQTAATASAATNTAPAGPDGTWITPPVPATGTQPALPGVATGPAPAGDVLALGGPGAEYAFDVTTRTWILAPTSGYSYKPGVGYVSGTSGPVTDPPPTISSLAPGPDGAWIVAPVAATMSADGTALPALPGVATGPAPAGDVIALGPPDSEYAFDVTTHTWILQASTSYSYKDGVGYVSAG